MARLSEVFAALARVALALRPTPFTDLGVAQHQVRVASGTALPGICCFRRSRAGSLASHCLVGARGLYHSPMMAGSEAKPTRSVLHARSVKEPGVPS
jgi:hypothetical protein